jgi:hypothetical protein
MTLLERIAAEYKVAHGEAEYRYFKKRSVFSHRERGHITPIGDGEEVTKAEYESNIEESERNGNEAFWHRLKRSYDRYYKNISKDGWHEILVKDVENMPR